MSKQLVADGDSVVSVDLNTLGTVDQILDVSAVDEISIQATASTWTTAEVTLQRGSNNATFVGLSPVVVFTAGGQQWRVDVRDARYLAMNVTTVEGGASTATFDINGRRGPPIDDFRMDSFPSTSREGSRVYRTDLAEFFYFEKA